MLGTGTKTVGVVRNPYERVIALYRAAWMPIGIRKWTLMQDFKSQKELYKSCDDIISYSGWMEELNELNPIHPDTSQVERVEISKDFRSWYDWELKEIVDKFAIEDCEEYGYTF
jgi:hypothetical protein